MANKLKIILLIALNMFAFACSYSPDSQENITGVLPRVLTSSEVQLIDSGEKFGFKLFKKMVNQQPDTNIIISPLSISMALGMAYNGSAEETRSAMHETLEFGNLTVQEVNESYESLINILIGLDDKVIFDLANSIWCRTGYPILPEFININQQYFDAVVDNLDFDNNTAVDTMNMWVNQNTNGLIEDIISAPINPNTVMFLMNAIYFKASWSKEFNQDKTHNAPFYLSDNSTLECEMMSLSADFEYFENEQFQAIKLPYSAGVYNMAILLPKEENNINEIINTLSHENWQQWNEHFNSTTINLFLPKFKIEYSKKLNNALKNIGMNIAFSDEADFSNMDGTDQLFISNVNHKTWIEINEEGTEAAAATSVEMTGKGMNMDTTFNVNHPFIFLIYEEQSKAILFIGKINNVGTVD